jgi:hypothetical protein
MTTPNKRKRRTITIETKKQTINASAIKKAADLVKEFGLPESSIRTIIKDKDKIQTATDDGVGGKRAKSKAVKEPELEEALLKWLEDVRSENVAVDGPLIKASSFLLFDCNYV